MAYLIDTNVIVRLFTKNPKEQFVLAKEFFEKVAEGAVVAAISEGVVLESLYVLTKIYGLEKKRVVENLLRLFMMKNVISEEKVIIVEALKILQRRNIDFIDALLCARAAVQGHKIYSFDTDIQKCLKENDAV